MSHKNEARPAEAQSTRLVQIILYVQSSRIWYYSAFRRRAIPKNPPKLRVAPSNSRSILTGQLAEVCEGPEEGRWYVDFRQVDAAQKGEGSRKE